MYVLCVRQNVAPAQSQQHGVLYIERVKLFHINLLKSKWNKFVGDLCVHVSVCERIHLVGRMFKLIPKRIQYVQTNEQKKAEFFLVSTRSTVKQIFHSAHHIILR